MPMSPPPNPSAGALQQNLNATAAAHQVTPVSPSSPDACTRCYSIYLQQFHAAIQEHEHQSQQKQMSLSRNSSEEYNRFLEAGRASIADVRLHFDSVRQTCSVCAERPPEDSVENVKVAFRDVMPIRGLPAACAQSGKRKIDSEHVSNETESTSKSRRVSPEILLPALCESTPPPEPDGTPKFLLADVNDMFVGFYRPRPVDDFVPSGLLERTARSLGLATEKSTHVAARNDPPKGDWTNMFYDPVIDSGKMSEAGRLSLEEETGKPRHRAFPRVPSRTW
ncbi:hypothetical protein K491DRAFT_276607 [Lophiostoma macrostomum CBS 122681]|uniref:Uncharacterized protein n=1 Tax=Lophiostoma macrostomum CBS 122681 TaxID=1314788 RepID=A0A6A6THC9_9PLEO|nr:hypothetical protein K491DRAFT_276607 [Lophiostoma macrostomum CBS 122681]